MDIKKIIREEVNDFDWVEKVPSNKPRKLNLQRPMYKIVFDPPVSSDDEGFNKVLTILRKQHYRWKTISNKELYPPKTDKKISFLTVYPYNGVVLWSSLPESDYDFKFSDIINAREFIEHYSLNESNDFDWVEEHEFNYVELIQHIIDNNITEWTFGKTWDGSLYLKGTPIKSLGNLESVGGNLYLKGTPIESLGNLESVGDSLYLHGTPIKSLGNLESVGGSLYLKGTPIKSLGNLKSVGGYLDLYKNPIESLGNLESVGGYLNLKGTPISKKYSEQEIRNMVRVNGNVYL